MLQSDSVYIGIVDDHSIVVEGLKTLLKDDMSIKVVATFNNGKQIEKFLKNNKVNVLLLDISLPDISGIDLCKKIKQIAPKTKVLALSNHSERSIILQMLYNGASGYLLKNISSQELKSSIYGAMRGEIVFCKEVSKILAQPNKDEFKEIPRLTNREKEILILVAKGLTTNEIADKIFVSPLTVETHRRNLMAKFQVKNAAELIMEATKNKLI